MIRNESLTAYLTLIRIEDESKTSYCIPETQTMDEEPGDICRHYLLEEPLQSRYAFKNDHRLLPLLSLGRSGLPDKRCEG